MTTLEFLAVLYVALCVGATVAYVVATLLINQQALVRRGSSWRGGLDAGDLLRPLIYHHAAAAYESQFGSGLPARYHYNRVQINNDLGLGNKR